MSYEILVGDVRDKIKEVKDNSVQCVVTSPPYWNLRNYEEDKQIGREESADTYIKEMVKISSEIKRVLKDDGVYWLNLGDGYTDKCLDCIPWRVALALKEDGWILRSDIIWSKPNPMPISVKDRCTSSHEYIFMLVKEKKYYFDMDSILEPLVGTKQAATKIGGIKHSSRKELNGLYSGKTWNPEEKKGRHKRTVWSMSTSRSKYSHFAVFPKSIPETCIKASSKVGDTVLDPFNGSGTTGIAACQNGRNYIGIELNEEYVKITEDRFREECAMENLLS